MTHKITLFLPSLTLGGAERVMAHLARGFVERGHPVDVVLAQAIGECLRDLPEEARVVDLMTGRALGGEELAARAEMNRLVPRQTLRSLPALVRYLRRERPRAVVAALEHASIVALVAGWLAGGPTRVAVTIHNTVASERRNARNLGDRVTPWIAGRLYPGARAVIAVSGGVADTFSRVTGLARDRIEVVYNPVITPQLGELAAAPVEHPWFAPGAPPVILGTGRLVFEKDFATLLRAFALVRQTREARLAILGEGVDRPQLEGLARELGVAGDVWLPGFVDNPYAYMARSAVFTLSSRLEGLPTALIEALAAGAPVVTTDCPHGPAEIVARAGSGRLVPVGDPPALARAILETLAGPPAPVPELREFGLSYAPGRYLELVL